MSVEGGKGDKIRKLEAERDFNKRSWDNTYKNLKDVVERLEKVIKKLEAERDEWKADYEKERAGFLTISHENAELKANEKTITIIREEFQKQLLCLESKNAELQSRIEAGKRIFEEIKELTTLEEKPGPIKCTSCGQVFPDPHIYPCKY